ncbi:hypothetical protein BKA67DRAFT_580255 [Truncatella angustata]|uniref:Ribosomal protein L9 domain-containing protein n=1 Tax=Truncatella angustata TaxID=152316 RepID=A0A9P8RP10_9PEZI|nr:uncharacterized protein BKA67DRAFT_580255 [Truncatella angustata]KAH6646691.1 hypothetical protein BKA67DRAFT_580255 [Truncatella angustata]
MATPRLARTLTCPNCLGRLPLSRPAVPSFPSPLQLGLTQVRHARTLTKAELEDLQGIPVRLLKNVIGFGKQNAIIRVKPGRMRNQWHHKGLAEYMTKKRFEELGLTESAIGVRDRAFGKQTLDDETSQNNKDSNVVETPTTKKKDVVTMAPDESRALLSDLLPATLIFARKPINSADSAQPEVSAPEPSIPRSPSLAANAQTSMQQQQQSSSPGMEPAVDTTTIFGSVSSLDIQQRIREALLADRNGSRVALEVDGISIKGLEAGEDRIKRLGVYEVEIVTGKGLEPVRRTVEVVSEAEFD